MVKGYYTSKVYYSSDGQSTVTTNSVNLISCLISWRMDADGWVKIWDGAPGTGKLLLHAYAEAEDDDGNRSIVRNVKMKVYCANGISLEVNDSRVSCSIIYDDANR